MFVAFCHTCRLLPLRLHLGPRTLYRSTAYERKAKQRIRSKPERTCGIDRPAEVSGPCEGRAGLLRRRGAAAAVRDVQPARTPRPLNVSLNGGTHRLSNCRYDPPPLVKGVPVRSSQYIFLLRVPPFTLPCNKFKSGGGRSKLAQLFEAQNSFAGTPGGVVFLLQQSWTSFCAPVPTQLESP